MHKWDKRQCTLTFSVAFDVLLATHCHIHVPKLQFFLWPPYGIRQDIIFLSSGFFYLLPSSSFFFFFPLYGRFMEYSRPLYFVLCFLMVAVRSRCGHYILQLGYFLLLLSWCFRRLISAVVDCMSTILLHMVCLSANLECRSEICWTRLAGNTGRKKWRNKSPSAHHRTTLSGYIFATKACVDNRKKTLKSNICSRCPHNMPNCGWGPLASLGHPSKFQRVSRLGFVKAKFHYASWFQAGSRTNLAYHLAC